MIRPHDQARKIRHQEAHPGDHAADGHLRGDRQAHGGEQEHPILSGPDAQRFDLLVRQREQLIRQRIAISTTVDPPVTMASRRA